MTAPSRQGKTWIKICGIKSVGMARIATEAGADAIGLVFAKKSPRVIELEHALMIAESLPETVTAIALFQIITLPVEFNASRRALQVLPEIGILTDEENRGARSVLTAAAMTYVAATIAAVWTLIYWLWRLGLIGGSSRD